jgi:protocatechuate 3,4-dioxygenase beta subunit
VDFGFKALGSWSGNVSKDTDNDDQGEENLQGVTITLYTDPNGDGDPEDGAVVATTTTDADGNYRFEGLLPGHYVAVETQPDGLIDVVENEGGDDDDQPDNHIVNAIAGYVDANEEDTHNDFVEEEPDTAYRIGDLFWIDEDGDGEYDPGEQTIGNAKVELLDEEGNVIDETTTDENGRYHFDVPAGKYKVRFHIPQDLLDEGYDFVPTRKPGDETNKVTQDGIVETAVEVGPGIASQNLTLDAAVECACADAATDSVSALSPLSMAIMMLLGMLMALGGTRRREQIGG